jgi:hypothetical protein
MNNLIRYWTSLNGRNRILDAFLHREDHGIYDEFTVHQDGMSNHDSGGRSTLNRKSRVADDISRISAHHIEKTTSSENLRQSNEPTEWPVLNHNEDVTMLNAGVASLDASAGNV